MKKPRSSPLALAVLALLYEEPMHPYRMQRLIEERGKDDVVNVRRRSSLYQTIDRLARANLVSPKETVRDANRPERTVYQITDEGRRTARAWLRNMLAEPAREFPRFPAALAHLPMLTTDDARARLDRRLEALREELESLQEQHRRGQEIVPRLFLVESEYLIAMVEAEIRWTAGLVDDLRTGALAWDEDWLREVADEFRGDGDG
jgi:DNA-binding PadR family transcriptional regulator